MQKINIAKFFILMIIIPFFLTGCYDRYELDNLAYVIAIGADTGSDGNLNISYQIAIPLKITGEDSETGKETYTTFTVSAPSLSIANTLINSKTSNELNLSQIKLILYSEELARNELSGHVNALISHTNIRPKTTVAICKGKAEDFLKEISPKLEANPARYYELLFSSHNYTNRTVGSELINFYTSTQSIDREAFATYLKFEEKSGDEKEVDFSGIAVFRGTNMIDILDSNLIFPHLILTNSLKKSGYVVPDFNDSKRVISVTIKQQEAPKIEVALDGDTPHINCNINLEAHLVSSGTNINFYDEKNKSKLKSELEKKIKKDISEYLDKTIKEYKSDITGFGRFAKSNYLIWEDFEKYDWLNKYQNSTYDVNVNVKLNISQIISHIIPNSEK